MNVLGVTSSGSRPARVATIGSRAGADGDATTALRTGAGSFANLVAPGDSNYALPVLTPAIPDAIPGPAIGVPADRTTVVYDLTDRRSLDGQPRGVMVFVKAKGLPGERSPHGVPRGPIREARETHVRAVVRAGHEPGAPDPQATDLITGFLPFPRSSLDHAIDRFLEPWNDVGAAIPELGGPGDYVSGALAMSVAVLSLGVAIRLLRSWVDEIETDGVTGLITFPGLPGPRRWSRS